MLASLLILLMIVAICIAVLMYASNWKDFLHRMQVPLSLILPQLLLLFMLAQTDIPLRIPFALATCVGIAVTLSLLLGSAAAASDVQNNEIKHTLRTSEGWIYGRLIRSGDRGVMFRDVNKSVILFLRREDFRELLSAPLAAAK